MALSYKSEAFVVHGDWSPETRKHTACRFLESGCKDFFDAEEHNNIHDWYTDDFSMKTPHKDHYTDGREDAYDRAVEKFFRGPFSRWKHVPDLMIAIESDSKDGFDLYVDCHLFVNVRGNPAKGEAKVKDPQGQEWDISIPAYYHFDLARDANAVCEGLKIRHIKLIKDTHIIYDTLDKRGERRPSI